MALSKENTVGLNQPEGFVSEAIEEGADSLAKIEPLVELLIELNLLDGAETSEGEPISSNGCPNFAVGELEGLTSLLVHALDLEQPAIQPPQLPQYQDALGELRSGWQTKLLLPPSKQVPVQKKSPTLTVDVEATTITVEKLPSPSPVGKELNSLVPPRKQVPVQKKSPTLTVDVEATTITVEKLASPSPVGKELNSLVPPSKQVPVQEKSPTLTVDVETPTINVEKLPSPSVGPELEKSAREQSAKPNENESDPEDALSALRGILMGNALSDIQTMQNLLEQYELPGFDHTMATLEHKLANLEHQIYEPKELMNLILPWIAELLSLKVSQAREEVASALSPVIDTVIRKKIEEDKLSMILTLAPLLPDIIAEQIRSQPEDFAKAIAPEIAVAVGEQIRLSPESMVESMAPIVAQMIERKTQLDSESMIAAIAPLISPAIAAQIRSSPDEIAKALGPEIASAVREQIRISRDTMVEALAPIIDQMIQSKSQQDQKSIITAIAPLLPAAIAAQIRNSPEEIAKVLGPEIAAAVKEQIRVSRDAMVEALSPIINQVIENKTQADKSGIIAAIAPLIPDAITAQIRNYPDEIAKAIGPEVAAAMKEQIRIDRQALAEALAPEMGNAIKAQIALEKDAMVDALYPVIGNTISKYMVEAIRSINDKVANAFSIEGMQRKVRAKMQGVSEGELILKDSLPLTVQAAFLIHKASGLVISEVQHPGREKLESEMVAGMLTAIRSFVNDCIVQTGEMSELNEIEYGASKIILEVAGYCYLAVVVKGEPPKQFLEKLREILTTIITKYGKSVEAFDGDQSIIPDAVQSILEKLIEVSVPKLKEKKHPMALFSLGLAIFSFIAIPLGIYQYRQGIDRRLIADTTLALASAPELSVYRLNVRVEGDKLQLMGRLPNQNLRAKAAKIARTTVPTMQLDNQIIAVDVPPDPVLAAAEVKRVTTILNQMEGVSIVARYDNRRVTVEGTVMQMVDAHKIAQSFKQIPGVQSVISTVKLNPLTISTRIYFEAGSAALSPTYAETIDNIKEFLKQYPQKHLKIIGHSDPSGKSDKNEQLARQRAEAVREALVQRGVNSKRLPVVAYSNPPQDVESNQPLLLSRCVLFEPITPARKSK